MKIGFSSAHFYFFFCFRLLCYSRIFFFIYFFFAVLFPTALPSILLFSLSFVKCLVCIVSLSHVPLARCFGNVFSNWVYISLPSIQQLAQPTANTSRLLHRKNSKWNNNKIRNSREERTRKREGSELERNSNPFWFQSIWCCCCWFFFSIYFRDIFIWDAVIAQFLLFMHNAHRNIEREEKKYRSYSIRLLSFKKS